MPSGRTRPWPASRDLWHHYWSPKRLAIGVLLLSGSLTVVEVLLWRLDLPLPLSKHYFYLPPVIAALSGYWALHDSKFKICHDLFGSRCDHLVHWLPILCSFSQRSVSSKYCPLSCFALSALEGSSPCCASC